MQCIKLWGEIHSIYKATNSNFILKRNGHSKLFYSALVVYVLLSGGVCFFSDTNFFVSVVVIFFAAISVNLVFGYVLAKDYEDELKGHSFFTKPKYVRYIEFSKEFEFSTNLTVEMIPALLEWEEVRNKKFDTLNLFTNPLTLLILSAFLSQLFAGFSSEGKDIQFLVVASYLFMTGMFISWTVYDFLSSSKKRSFEICRLLRWIQLEVKS